MYILLTVTCFLLAFQAHARRLSLHDASPNNPCVEGSGVFFYPHPSDPHKFIQCDGVGKSYVQTCAGDLVWDDLIKACNYASAASPPASGGGSQSPSEGSSETPSEGGSETPSEGGSETPSEGGSETPSEGGSETPSEGSSETPSDGSSETSSSASSSSSSSGSSAPQISFPNTPTDSASSGSNPSSSATSSSSSLCKPKNPCGDHGECIESPASSSSKRRRFACICEEGWVGRLCDKQSSDLSTPKTRINHDQLISVNNKMNRMEPMSHLNKRMVASDSNEEFFE